MRQLSICLLLLISLLSGCKDKMAFYPNRYNGKHLRIDDGYFYAHIYDSHIDVTEYMIFYRNGIVRKMKVEGIVSYNLLDETFSRYSSLEPSIKDVVAFKINPPLISFSGRKKGQSEWTVYAETAAIFNDTTFCRSSTPDTFRFRRYTPKPDSLSCLQWMQY